MSIVSHEKAIRNLELIKNGVFSMLPEDNVCRKIKRSVVDFDYDNQTLTMEYVSDEWMRNASGAMHGGMQALCVDQTTGALAGILCDCFAATVSLSMKYLRAVPRNGVIIIKGYGVHFGSRNANIRAEIYSKETGELLATANAVHYIARGKSLQGEIEK